MTDSIHSKGGKARAAKLSPERRREIAREAGLASGVARKKELASKPSVVHGALEGDDA